eukprot:7960114-Pyramimonas_sp.AAC.1
MGHCLPRRPHGLPEGLTYQELAEAIGKKERAARVNFAAWIGHGASNSPRIRTLQRAEALLAVP